MKISAKRSENGSAPSTTTFPATLCRPIKTISFECRHESGNPDFVSMGYFFFSFFFTTKMSLVCYDGGDDDLVVPIRPEAAV